MKKKLVSTLAVASLLLMTACSTGEGAVNKTSNPTSTASESPSVPASESATPEEKLKLADYNKFDAKFEITGATKKEPYGVNYEYLTTSDQMAYFTNYNANDINEAVEAGLRTYYNIRTEPEFMKTNRTKAKDSKVLDKYSSELGNLLKDAWAKDKELFSYAPFYPFLNAGLFTYDSSSGKTIQEHLDTYESYNVDTRKIQKVSFIDPAVTEQTMKENGLPSLEIIFNEKIEYALENEGIGTFTSEIKLLMQKNAKGVWQIQGMYWSGLDQTIKDANGANLPGLKKAEKSSKK